MSYYPIQIVNGTAQIGIGHIIIETGRFKSVDFLSFLYPLNIHIVSAIPRPYSKFMNVVRPYSLGVWMGLVGSLLAATAAISALSWFGCKIDGQRRLSNTEFAQTIFEAYAILLQQQHGENEIVFLILKVNQRT
jgi:hypothetical protein